MALPGVPYMDILKLQQGLSGGDGSGPDNLPPVPYNVGMASPSEPAGPTDPTDQDVAAFKKMNAAAQGIYPGATPEELKSEAKKKLLGIIASAVLGGLVSKKTHGGGAAGAGAAVGAFDQNFVPTAQNANLVAQAQRPAAAKTLMDVYRERAKTHAAKAEPAIIGTFRAAHGGAGPANEQQLFDFVHQMSMNRNAAARNAVMEQFNAYKQMKPEDRKLFDRMKTGPMSTITASMFPELFQEGQPAPASALTPP